VRLNPLDAVWLMMESADTPMHVGVLAVFKKPARAPADYLATMAAQMRQSREPAAPWHYRLAQVGSSALAPRLVEDAHFDLDYHFRHSALPAPGGERELGVVVSRLHSMELDRNRPLWEFHLIEGLERNRFACYLKVHHALVDNVTGIPLFTSLLSSRARDRQLPPPWCVPLDLSGAAADSDFDSGELWRALAQPADTLASLRQASSGFLRNIARRGSDGSVLLPRGTPRSTLNRRINAQRRFATQQFELARIESLAAASDTTVNTILAYLCGSSLRRFFKEYNALPEASLIGALPVSLQERSAQVAGNAIADLRVALGTHIGDPLARLEAVKAALDEVRRDRASLPASAVTPYVLLRSAPVYASQLPGVGRFVPPLYNLGVSNTLGPGQRLYYNGARLEAIYPLSQLMQFSALSIDCVSYAGTFNIGFTGARDTLPHLQRLAVYTGRAVDDLERLLGLSGEAA